MRDADDPAALLREMPGIGPTGADIFLREVQAVWPEYRPYFDKKTQQGAEKLGLPTSPEKLAELVDRQDQARFAAALVRAALDRSVVEDARQEAREAA